MVWRVGDVGMDGEGTSGHWLGATYEHSDAPLAQRRWFKKDSLAPGSVATTFQELLSTLDAVERQNRDFLIIVDIAD